MPTIPIFTSSGQQGGTCFSDEPNHINQTSSLSSRPPMLPIQGSGPDSTSPIHSEPSSVIPNQSNTVDGGISSYNNIIGDQVDSNSTSRSQRLVTLSSTGILKKGKIQNQVRYINTFIHMVAMTNLLLLHDPER
ncbi:hypothetical protein P3S68_024126 [Capsicum galapagoense]